MYSRIFLDNSDGFVLPIILGMVSILVILGTSFISIIKLEMDNTTRQLYRTQAFYLAEAGLNRGIMLLRDDDDWSDSQGATYNSGSPDADGWYNLYEPNGGEGFNVSGISLDSDINGTYSVKLKNIDDNTIYIKSTGTISDSKIQGRYINRVNQIRVALSEESGSSVFAWGIFSNDELRIVGNASTDSYNSDDGLYEEQTPNANGDIGSNDNITLIGNVTIKGDAIPGPDYAVSQTGNVTVAGSTAPASEIVELPALEIEDFDADDELESSRTLTDGTYYFEDIELEGNSILEINGDVTLYCESLDLEGNSEIAINSDSNLTIYCTGDFESTGNSIFNNISRKPEDLTLYCTGEDEIKLTGNSDFYGAVYVPNGDVRITGNHDYYGAIVSGGEVKGAGNAKVHYDEALADVVDVVSMEGERTVDTSSWRSY